MNILRKFLGNDAVISTPAASQTSKPAPAAPATPQSQAAKENLLRTELAGADAARLTTLALTDKRAAMRILAAQALAALPAPRDTWESIAHTWADKDRRLSRLAREHIAAFVREADLEARAAALTADFAALLDKPAVDLTRLIELDALYDQIKQEARKEAQKDAQTDTPLKPAPTNGFTALAAVRAEVGTHLEAGQDAQRQLIAIEREADAARLALVAQQSVADPLQHAALAERMQALDTTAVPAVIVERTRKALSALEQLVQSALARGAAEHACRELMARIDLLDPVDMETRNALEAAILAAGLPQDLLVRAKDAYDLRTGGADAARRAQEREAAQATRAAQRESRTSDAKAAHDALAALVSETEAHLAAGEAKAAIRAAGTIKQHRAEAEHLPPALRARFHAIESEVLKLEGFARDHARTARATLMERARKLPELTLNIEMLRTEVQTLQNEWKALDLEAGGAPRKLWDEFHTATNKAYETVTLYRAVKAAERDQHLKLKEAQLAEIEALAAAASGTTLALAPPADSSAGSAADSASSATDPAAVPATDPATAPAITPAVTPLAAPEKNAATQPPEWNKIAARRGELVRAWYDQGGVGRKEQKALQARMDRALKTLDGALDAERARERTRRRALVDQVEAARARAEAERPADAGVNDRPWPALADAMQVAQDCQKLWNQRVSPLMLPRKEEQALWEKFRALGNTVFEMRAEAREAVKAKQGAAREEHTQHIAALRTLKQETVRATVQTRLTELQTAWRNSTARPDRGSERQYDEAVELVKAHLMHLKRSDERSVWDVLMDLDDALTQAEMRGAPQGNTEAQAAAWPEKISAIEARLDPKHAAHAGIGARKAAALSGKPLAAKVKRTDLLLDLELTLAIPAQPGEEAARRARQMVLLSNTLKDRGVRPAPRDMLLNLIGTSGTTARHRLAAIIGKL